MARPPPIARLRQEGGPGEGSQEEEVGLSLLPVASAMLACEYNTLDHPNICAHSLGPAALVGREIWFQNLYFILGKIYQVSTRYIL
jgi:hypothetical protein